MYFNTTSSLSSSLMSIPDKSEMASSEKEIDNLLDELLSDDDEAFDELVRCAVEETFDQEELDAYSDFQDDISLAVFLEGQTERTIDEGYSMIYRLSVQYHDDDVSDAHDDDATREDANSYDETPEIRKQTSKAKGKKWAKFMRRVSPFLKKAAHLR
jgi:hypothetical protein